ncbi:hypothetical protein [Pelagimonas phthalicica]|uniref:hypothetical protein n=1 Tax=Pelagimonas phthalicica TaxID=1037362 RepID=UPI001060202A|nr:hypothetical protein [Pelagimonas phthalicica]
MTEKEWKSWVQIGTDITGLPPFGPVYGKESGLVYVFPPNGPGFSADAYDDCAFYKWSAQMFGWITSDVNAAAEMHTGRPGEDTQYVLSSNFFFGVSSPGNDANFLPQGAIKTHGVRTPKPVNADGTAQAGSSGVLLSQGANEVSKESSLVYGGVSTNRMYGYMAQRYQQAYTTPAGNPISFLQTGDQTCDLMDYAWENDFIDRSAVGLYFKDHLCGGGADPSMVDSKQDSPLTISDLETAIDYLSMSMLLKTTWVESSTLQHPEQYIQQMAVIPRYDKTSDTEWTVSQDDTPVALALVGMHVVGSVKGHPEMIWATFEHVNNAPSVPYEYNGTTPCATETGHCIYSDMAHQTGGSWLFSNGTTDTPNVMTAEVAASGNIKATSGNTIVPTNAVRETPFGNPTTAYDGAPTTPSAADKNTMLISLNKQVMGLFKKKDGSDPRANYFLSGSVWTDGTQWPNSPTDMSTTLGSTKLANTTAETFTQDQGCFNCHYDWMKDKAGKPVAATTTLSHIYGNFVNPPGQDTLIPVFDNAVTD